MYIQKILIFVIYLYVSTTSLYADDTFIDVGAALDQYAVFVSEQPPDFVQLEDADFVVQVDSDEQEICLAEAIYFEARGEVLEGRKAVAKVILERVFSDEYPDTICEVVRQKHQFSFYWDNKPDIITDMEAWEAALELAVTMLSQFHNITNILYYHAVYVEPKWASTMELVAVIGNHKFYRP